MGREYNAIIIVRVPLLLTSLKQQKEFVWTSEMAYAIGLITTDGNLSPDGRHFDFTSNDVDLIETFKSCLNLTNRIGRKKSTYTGKFAHRVQFGDVFLYHKLVEIGLMPNKSKVVGALKIPNDLFFDFLRGSLDGDGSIKTYHDPIFKNSVRLYVKFTSASLKHVLWLQDTITKLIKIKGYIRKNTRAFDLTYAKKDSIVLLKKIYYTENLPCLKRKINIAKNFI